MLPVNCGSHADYQNFVVTNLRKYYPNPNALARSTWDIIERFWSLDLSFTDTFMADKYSKFGPTPRTPSCMQRSYLFSIDFKVTSLTEWAAQLKMNPLYAILSGFEVGNTPGVCTFYDFLNRLWNSDDDHMSPHIHPLKIKIKKPKQKVQKLIPWKKLQLPIFFRPWRKQISNLMNSLILLSLKSIKRNSLRFLFLQGLSMQMLQHQRVMERLL